jgi:hypothetical protein
MCFHVFDGGIQGSVLWFSANMAMINGLQLVAGDLGALGATIHLQNALSYTDSR